MSSDRETQRTVLIVDDSQALLGAFVLGLPLVGPFEVITASDGAEGLERYFADPVHLPDCVVIDIKMPGLDGYQLVRALRGDANSMHTPLIILTALAQEQDRLAGLLSGVDRFLVKPVLPSELGAVIQEVCLISDEERMRRLRKLVEDPNAEGDPATPITPARRQAPDQGDSSGDSLAVKS
jgi:DNA-binding response OmpR family regulator